MMKVVIGLYSNKVVIVQCNIMGQVINMIVSFEGVFFKYI